MAMSDVMRRYRALEQELIELRTRSGGRYTHDEDANAEAMLAVWDELTDAERAQLDAEGPRAPNIMAAYCRQRLVEELPRPVRHGWHRPLLGRLPMVAMTTASA